MAAAMMMMMMIRRVKASKMVAAELMGNLIKMRPFCTVTPPPPPPPPILISESAADMGKGTGVGYQVKEEDESLKKEARVWKVDPVAEELAAERRRRRRGGPTQIDDASNCEEIKELAIFGLEQINQREHTNLQLVRVLGAWSRFGPGCMCDITLEATDGAGKPNFYRVSVADIRAFVGYEKLELVQWLLLDGPSPPIKPFESGSYSKYATDLLARMKSLREARPPDTCSNPNANWWSYPKS